MMERSKWIRWKGLPSKKSLQERLLEEFDCVEDLGYIDDSISSIGDCGTAYVTMNIRDKISTDGLIDVNSFIAKEYGINHQYQTYELVVKNNPTYIIGVRKLYNDDSDEDYYYTTLFANYSRIDISTFFKILEERNNIKRSFIVEDYYNE